MESTLHADDKLYSNQAGGCYLCSRVERFGRVNECEWRLLSFIDRVGSWLNTGKVGKICDINNNYENEVKVAL